MTSEERGAVVLDGLGELRRTHPCGSVGTDLVDQEVVVLGWVHRRRDHGGVIFVDLRDRTGLVQVVFRPDASGEAHARSEALRSEFVIAARGVVERRSEDTVNPNLPTGEIEVLAEELRILNTAVPPPFPIEDDPGVDESVRLRHRIHDLRRPPLQRALEMRHQLSQAVPDAALGPRTSSRSRRRSWPRPRPRARATSWCRAGCNPGQFYALPQSPQLMKQLLMIAGFERYFQIARCFRDEDQRADRQLEFTQIDLEMSFVGEEDVLEVLEDLTCHVAAAAGRRAAAPVPAPLLRRLHGALRHRPARHPHPARARRADRRLPHQRFRAFRGARGRGRHREVPADPRRRGPVARRHRPSRELREEGARGPRPGLDPGHGRRRLAVADREVPLGGGERGDRRALPGAARAACSSSRPTRRRAPMRSSRGCASISASASAASTAAPGTRSSWWTSRSSSAETRG